ncbi:MAG: flippase-like domain-containing protein [Clostridiaceae bacterium]|nr:flippase-like domain-containing protein [Clostridiaceae bacterium]
MKKFIWILLFILLSVTFWKFDFSGFIISIRQVSPLAFTALLMVQVISQLLVNYQWCRIGKVMGRDHNFFKMLYVNARGSIVESVTPGVKVGGEVTRAILLKNEMKYSTQEAAILVTIQKMVSFFSFFVINLFAFAHISGRIEGFQSGIIKAVVYFLLLALIGSLIFIFKFTSLLENKIGNTFPKHRRTAAFKRFMITLLSNIKVLKSIRGEMYRQLLLSFGIWILYPVKMILLVRLFSTGFDWIFLTGATFVSYMMGMLPLLPGGLGSFEATMTSLLIVMQINSNDALAITLLFRFITFWFVIIISLLYAGIWKLRGGKSSEISDVEIFT